MARKGSGLTAGPNRVAMARAVRSFLRAAGANAARDGDLARTPDRVADAWCDAFIDGYARDPRALLAERFAVPADAPVLIRRVAVHGMCPHHLLPWSGVAHVGYVPCGEAVGFSRIAELVDCFAHRLTLQEEVARRAAHALVEILGARAAVCGIDAEHTCLTLRGVRRTGARVWSECSAGDERDALRLRALLLMESRPPLTTGSG